MIINFYFLQHFLIEHDDLISCKYFVTFYNITKTSPCNEYPLTPHFYIVKLGFTWVYNIFLFLL